MVAVYMYTTAICPYCMNAKKLLTAKGIAFQEIRVDVDPARRDEMVRLSGRRTVPQIFIDDQPVGGFDDLKVLNETGELDRLLQSKGNIE